MAKKKAKDRTGSLGFEAKLWEAADLLRSNMDPAEYKHVVLGLLFIKYISDAFEERREELTYEVAKPESEYYVKDPKKRQAELSELLEDRDEFTAENIFWVPSEARWSSIQAQAKQPEIGKIVDDAMDAIERENPTLKGVLPKVFALPGLNKHNLGQLIDLVSGIGLGTKEHQDKDTLGRVYEYFLSRFASSEGKGGGEFYTPKEVAKLMVEILRPEEGQTVYDPACGSGGMLLEATRHMERKGLNPKSLALYGQEKNLNTWAICKMSLLLHDIDDLFIELGDTLLEPRHLSEEGVIKRFDLALASPPWGQRLPREVFEHDRHSRFNLGAPPPRAAEWGWLQHMLASLNERGRMAVVLSTASMSRGSGAGRADREKEIRRHIVGEDLLEAVILLPSNLFYGTSVAAVIVVLNRAKSHSGETLLINATEEVQKARPRNLLGSAQIGRIVETYQSWRADEPFSLLVREEQLSETGYDLSPARYLRSGRVWRLGRALGYDPTPLSEVMAEVNLTKASEHPGFEERPNAVYLPMIGRSDAVSSLDQLKLKPHNYAQLVISPERTDVAEYVAGFFNSPLGLAVREQGESGVIPKLTKTSLQSLTLYLPDSDRQEKVAKASATLRDLKSELEELEERLWSDPNRLDETDRRLSRFAREESFVEWLDTLPFPLASILWRYHTVGQDNRLRYQYLLHYFEALAEFIAVVLLSATTRDREVLAAAKEKYGKTFSEQHLSFERSSFGTWKCLVEQLAKVHRALLNGKPEDRTQSTDMFCTRDDDVLEMLTSRRLVALLQEANQHRNRWHGHGGVVGSREAERRHQALYSLLSRTRECFGTAWDRYKLLLPRSMTYRTDTQTRAGTFKHLAHLVHRRSAPFEQAEIELGHALEQGQLYLWSPGEREALMLLPLIRVLPSQESEDNACYFYSRRESGGLRFISYHFEREAERVEEFSDTADALDLLGGWKGAP